MFCLTLTSRQFQTMFVCTAKPHLCSNVSHLLRKDCSSSYKQVSVLPHPYTQTRTERARKRNKFLSLSALSFCFHYHSSFTVGRLSLTCLSLVVFLVRGNQFSRWQDFFFSVCLCVVYSFQKMERWLSDSPKHQHVARNLRSLLEDTVSVHSRVFCLQLNSFERKTVEL